MSETDPLRVLWKSRKEPAFTMSTVDMQARAHRFQSTIRTRNFLEYAAALFVIISFGLDLLQPEPLTAKFGAVLVILAAVFVCYKLHTLGQAAPRGKQNLAMNIVDFHRSELLRQRDALMNVWKWYLLPFVPGLVIFTFADGFTSRAVIKLILMVAVFLLIHWPNVKAAKKIDVEIDELNQLHQSR